MDLAAPLWTAEFIFHGTGSSGSVPNIECLTAVPVENSNQLENPCRTCHAALTPEGRKNRRRNTGAIIRLRRQNGTDMTIVIDVGKNFRESALEWFTKYGLRRIDAVLLTHAHADAVNGLDDLRAWTHRGAIQSHIDIYASRETFSHVQRAFPYLISSEFASGGGDVPKFKWHIIEPNKVFFVEDIEVHPFNVEHGRLFNALNTIYHSTPFTPASSHPTSPKSNSPPPIPSNGLPYFSLGFALIDIVYISDVSHIPDYTWDWIFSVKDKQFTTLIVDCLRLEPHTSHFGLAQAVAAARKLGAQRTYMVGFSHEILHDDWERLGKYFEDSQAINLPCDATIPSLKKVMEDIPKEPSVWIRPAYDGLRFLWDSNGTIQDLDLEFNTN